MILGLVGGVAGLGVAYAAVRVLVAIAPASLPRLDKIAIDPLVLLFTFAISIVAGLLFGAIPVFKYAGPQRGCRAARRRDGRSSRAASVIVRATRSSSSRWRWRSCCSSAPG